MHKSTLFLIGVFILFSCEKITVQPKNIDYKETLLKKVEINSTFEPRITIDFLYNEDGKVSSARKVYHNYSAKDSIVNYSMEYPNANEYSLKTQSTNYSKTERFNLSNSRVVSYEVEEIRNGITDAKVYTLSYGADPDRPDYFISEEGDSIRVKKPSAGSYHLESIGISPTIPYPGESIDLSQNTLSYTSTPDRFTGTYSDLCNPFQKEVWEVFGITLGSRLLTLASNNLANEYLIFSLKDERIFDGGPSTFEYLFDEKNRLTNINEIQTGYYPGTNGNIPLVVKQYILFYDTWL